MKKYLVVSVILCVAMLSNAAIVDDFESYSGTTVMGQQGWSGTGYGLLTGPFGSPYVIDGVNSMYTQANAKAIKSWAGAGVVVTPKTNISFLSRLEVASGNDYWVTLVADIGAGSGLTARFINNASTGGLEQVQAYYDNGSGWDFYDVSLPGWGGSHKTYKLEFEVDFAAQSVAFFGTAYNGTRTAGLVISYDLGTAATMSSNGGIQFGYVGAGNMTVDNIDVTAIPEPATLFLLGLSGLAFVRRRK